MAGVAVEQGAILCSGGFQCIKDVAAGRHLDIIFLPAGRSPDTDPKRDGLHGSVHFLCESSGKSRV